jgi:hypothetical protein
VTAARKKAAMNRRNPNKTPPGFLPLKKRFFS